MNIVGFLKDVIGRDSDARGISIDLLCRDDTNEPITEGDLEIDDCYFMSFKVFKKNDIKK